MNKVSVILMIVMFSIIYLVYGMFLSDDTQNTSTEELNNRFETIKPPTLITNTVDLDSKTNDLLTVQNEEGNQQNTTGFSKLKRISAREELLDLYKNKKTNYITLGEMIEKIQSEKNTSKNVIEHLDRVKHNLEIAKKMAAFTKHLHVEIDGKKEFNNEVFKKLLEIQKQMIIPYSNVNYTVEN